MVQAFDPGPFECRSSNGASHQSQVSPPLRRCSASARELVSCAGSLPISTAAVVEVGTLRGSRPPIFSQAELGVGWVQQGLEGLQVCAKVAGLGKFGEKPCLFKVPILFNPFF